MKAIVYTEYGSADVLQLKEVEKPIPGQNEILVKVYATTVTAGDVRTRGFHPPSGWWLPARFALGFTKPRDPIPGMEMAGVIEAVGEDVTRFKEGDEVFASTYEVGRGAYAEYKCMPEDGMVSLKPANLSLAEAAAVPTGGNTALYFLKKGNVQKGQKILIIGASGSVGSFAVQIANYYGAHVTAVCSSRHLDLMRTLGAGEVIDYTAEEFSQNGELYDIIFDAVGKSSLAKCEGSLKERGVYLTVDSSLRNLLHTVWTARLSGKKIIAAVASERIEDLFFLKELIESGQARPVIDCCYVMDQIVEAHEYVDKGHKSGNVVIIVAESQDAQAQAVTGGFTASQYRQ